MKKNPLSLHVDMDDFLPATDAEKEYMVQMRPSTTFFKDGMKRLLRNKVAATSLIVIIVITLAALILPAFWPYSYETMLGVTECSAAVEAVRGLCDLPILCTMTLDAVGGAYFDGDAESLALSLPELGADAVGVNCGQGPELYVSVIQRMRAHTDLPLIAKPNAGLPVIQSDGSAVYGMSPGKFAREMLQLKKAGANILGGCCGTTPEHIRMLKEMCG